MAEEHQIKGDADAARSWIEASALPEDQKADLLRFVNNFASLTFVKEDDGLDGVALPAWLRETWRTLVFVDPPVLLRVDDFQWYNSPLSDDVEDIWYELWFGYQGEEQQALVRDDAGIYPIARWWGEENYLGIDLQHPQDQRIFDFSGADLRDNKLAGRPVRGSLYPVFSSYAQFLAHVTEVRTYENMT